MAWTEASAGCCGLTEIFELSHEGIEEIEHILNENSPDNFRNGYSAVYTTTSKQNPRGTVAILKKLKFKAVYKFKNHKTTNVCTVWMKTLKRRR